MYNIYLLGVGINPSLQITEETKQAIRASTEALVLHPDEEVKKIIRKINPNINIQDAEEFYSGVKIRQEAYKKISEYIIKRANSGSKISFIVHGHPLFLVSATEYIIQLATENNIKTRLVPAVSSFDTLMCDLGTDYGYAVQIFDTTTLLSNNWKINPEVPLLLFQLATTNNKEVVRNEPSKEILKPIGDLLKNFYPLDHEVLLTHSSTSIFESPEVKRLKISSLSNMDISLDRRPTLYVPAIRR